MQNFRPFETHFLLGETSARREGKEEGADDPGGASCARG